MIRTKNKYDLFACRNLQFCQKFRQPLLRHTASEHDITVSRCWFKKKADKILRRWSSNRVQKES